MRMLTVSIYQMVQIIMINRGGSILKIITICMEMDMDYGQFLKMEILSKNG